VESNLSLDDIFVHSEATYKIRLANHFVCFSPETFIKINNGIISSYPMKGTIRADLPRAAEQLLEDEKEMAEQPQLLISSVMTSAWLLTTFQLPATAILTSSQQHTERSTNQHGNNR
jgi:isochorismate synthase EntC